jgi:hypothetical protein
MALQGFYRAAVGRIVWKGKVRMEGERSRGNRFALFVRFVGGFFYRGLWLDRGARVFTSAEVGREDRSVRRVVWTWWNDFEDVRGLGDPCVRRQIGTLKCARLGGGNIGATRMEVRK